MHPSSHARSRPTLPAPSRFALLAIVLVVLTRVVAAQTADGPPVFASAADTDPSRLGWMTGYPPPPDKQVRYDDGSHYRFPQWRWSFSHWREVMPSAEISRGTGPVAVLARAERDDLDAVTFTYAGAEQPALKSLALTVSPGECVALLGPSGSGKTTIANLLPRFYQPESGQIRIDGHAIPDIRLASLRENIALVSQDVVLFNDTIAANIAYGLKRGASLEEIRAAARAAHALDFIEAQPDGFATMIGENGVKLSGGQRQRLAIARALLKDAPILILDEATSALDTESERHVQAALEALMQGRTTLVIAHRLSTIENADRIVVLGDGKVIEAGPHRELLARNGAYARLHSLQAVAESTVETAA